MLSVFLLALWVFLKSAAGLGWFGLSDSGTFDDWVGMAFVLVVVLELLGLTAGTFKLPWSLHRKQ